MSTLIKVTSLIAPGVINRGTMGFVKNVRRASSTPGRKEAVVVTDDGKTIVAWHPEPQIPYEMTVPLPEASKADTILKVENAGAVKKLFRNQHPFFVIKELRELTFTTKHPWNHKPEKRFAKKNPPRDREYL
ncbi:large ribosomal subunit protein mL42 [Macrobrachium rosenbergii]|uniref:large ribosomal subunit protein mL42 n=1 Tax=Macrobrachium rosenbergii TaxID=79674 RepID=UPI0034D7289A